MKLIIDIPEDVYNKILEIYNSCEELHTRENLYQTIANGTPYNPSGDSISREALRKNMEFVCMGIMAGTESYNAPLTEIDNAPTVETFTFDEVESIRQETIKLVRNSCKSERPTGKPLIRTNGDMSNYYICSECHYSIDGWDKFCKNCGADLRGKG